MVILSRATRRGADIREVFLSNTNHLQEIEQFSSLEDSQHMAEQRDAQVYCVYL